MTDQEIAVEVRGLAERIVASDLRKIREAALAVVKSRYEVHGDGAWDDLNNAIGNLADALAYEVKF